MKFQLNLSSIHIPLTKTYMVFRSKDLIVKKICETLDLLTIRYNTSNNGVYLPITGVRVQIRNCGGMVSFVSLSMSETEQRARYVKSVITKSLCLIQK